MLDGRVRVPQAGQFGHCGAVQLVEFDLAVMRVVLGHAHIFQRIAARAQGGIKHLSHDVIGTCRIEPVGVVAVAGARHDLDVGAMLAGILRQLDRLFRPIKRDHQNTRAVEPCGM